LLHIFVQGCTNSGHQVAITTKFCTVAPICVSSVSNLLYVAFGPYNFEMVPLFFEKFCTPPLIYIPSGSVKHFAEMNTIIVISIIENMIPNERRRMINNCLYILTLLFAQFVFIKLLIYICFSKLRTI
jgi:hypothetical protein